MRVTPPVKGDLDWLKVAEEINNDLRQFYCHYYFNLDFQYFVPITMN